MTSLNFFDILLAVLVGNSAMIAGVFAAMRLRKKDAWDSYSLGAIAYFAAILLIAGYFAT